MVGAAVTAVRRGTGVPEGDQHVELHCDGPGPTGRGCDLVFGIQNRWVPFTRQKARDVRRPSVRHKEIGRWFSDHGRDRCPDCLVFREGVWEDGYLDRRREQLSRKGALQ